MLLRCHRSLNPPRGVAPLLWGTERKEQVYPQCHNAQPLESQSGKFALAPTGLEDERDLGWHGSMVGGRRGALSTGGLISLYPVWRAVAMLVPHQLSTFLWLPVAVQSKAVLSADGLPGRMSVPLHPLLLWIYSSPYPGLKPSPEHPCVALGCSYKKMKGSGARAGWGWTRALAGVCGGLL